MFPSEYSKLKISNWNQKWGIGENFHKKNRQSSNKQIFNSKDWMSSKRFSWRNFSREFLSERKDLNPIIFRFRTA